MKSVSFKEQCIALRKQDKTLNEIVKLTGRSKTSIYFHIKDIPLSDAKQKQIVERTTTQARSVAAARKGKSLRPYKSFNFWTPDLVLLVAHLTFDGEINRSSCVYHNRSSSLITRVEKLMTLVYEYKPKRYKNRDTDVRRISYHNVALAAFFREKRTELLQNITLFSQLQQKEFVRAFFDDEGCMDYRPVEQRRSIRGYQNDILILHVITTLLSNLGIAASFRKPNEVVISGKENLEKFQKEINFSRGVQINPKRTNSRWKKNLEKRELLQMAIDSYQS